MLALTELESVPMLVALITGTSTPMKEEASFPLDVTSLGSDRMRARFFWTSALSVALKLLRDRPVPHCVRTSLRVTPESAGWVNDKDSDHLTPSFSRSVRLISTTCTDSLTSGTTPVGSIAAGRTVTRFTRLPG